MNIHSLRRRRLYHGAFGTINAFLAAPAHGASRGLAGGLAGAAGKGKGKAEAPAAQAADKDKGDKPAEAAPGKTPLEQTQEDDSLSLQEKQYFAKLYEEIAVEQKYANESCGIDIVGEYEKAIAKYEALIRDDPGDTKAWRQVGA